MKRLAFIFMLVASPAMAAEMLNNSASYPVAYEQAPQMQNYYYPAPTQAPVTQVQRSQVPASYQSGQPQGEPQDKHNSAMRFLNF